MLTNDMDNNKTKKIVNNTNDNDTNNDNIDDNDMDDDNMDDDNMDDDNMDDDIDDEYDINDNIKNNINNKKIKNGFNRNVIFDYIIFHSGCLDGFVGFFVAYISNKLNNNVFIYEDVPSTNRIPPNINNKNILIIDVAYKKEVLEEIFKCAKKVVFIDHHISIRDDVIDLNKKYKNKNIKIIYDENKCGATLTWEYFFTGKKIPIFLKYIEDQDTGKWIYPKTKEFIYALKVYFDLKTNIKTLNKWKTLLEDNNVTSLIKKGKYMVKYNEYLVNVNISKHTLERFPSKKVYNMNPTIFKKPGQYNVVVYCGHNCPSITDLGTGALNKMPNIDFCIMWVYNLDTKKYVLSMRSRDVDVSIICKLFNGGGHKLAAACSFYSDIITIDELFEGESLPRINIK